MRHPFTILAKGAGVELDIDSRLSVHRPALNRGSRSTNPSDPKYFQEFQVREHANPRARAESPHIFFEKIRVARAKNFSMSRERGPKDWSIGGISQQILGDRLGSDEAGDVGKIFQVFRDVARI